MLFHGACACSGPLCPPVHISRRSRERLPCNYCRDLSSAFKEVFMEQEGCIVDAFGNDIPLLHPAVGFGRRGRARCPCCTENCVILFSLCLLLQRHQRTHRIEPLCNCRDLGCARLNSFTTSAVSTAWLHMGWQITSCPIQIGPIHAPH